MVSYNIMKITVKGGGACLNPYCSGQWSRTQVSMGAAAIQAGLNPYCSGQWSRTDIATFNSKGEFVVLILIVVDNGLVQTLHKISPWHH